MLIYQIVGLITLVITLLLIIMPITIPIYLYKLTTYFYDDPNRDPFFSPFLNTSFSFGVLVAITLVFTIIGI